MELTRAKEIVSILADGIDPLTVNFCRMIMFAIKVMSLELCIQFCILRRKRSISPNLKMQVNLGLQKMMKFCVKCSITGL